MQTTNDTYRGDRELLSITARHDRLTRHANRRAQQRAISKPCIPLIRAYGERHYDGHGGVTYLMTSDAVEDLARAVGRTSSVERMEGVYIVVDAADERVVITVGHRWK